MAIEEKQQEHCQKKQGWPKSQMLCLYVLYHGGHFIVKEVTLEEAMMSKALLGRDKSVPRPKVPVYHAAHRSTANVEWFIYLACLNPMCSTYELKQFPVHSVKTIK